jgi:hypothetical protein
VFGDETTELHVIGFADKQFRRCASFCLRHFVLLPKLTYADRNDLNAARKSVTKSSGCSQAAK